MYRQKARKSLYTKAYYFELVGKIFHSQIRGVCTSKCALPCSVENAYVWKPQAQKEED